MNPNLYTSALEGAFTIVILLLIFGGVALLTYVIRKKFWPFPWENKTVDPQQAVKEELERVLVPIEEPLQPKDEQPVEAGKRASKKPKA
jgi:hypothetical protein